MLYRRIAKRGPCAALLIGLIVPTACLGPTEIELDIRTRGIDCGKKLRTSIAIGSEGTDPSTLTVPSATSETCGERIGNIFVVPNGRTRVVVRVTAGLDDTPLDHCFDATKRMAADQCVDVRRVIGFIPHTKLHMPIMIDRACVNVMCPSDQTCEDGVCVPSTAICDGGDCSVPSDAGRGRKVVRIGVGGFHACAVIDDGSLWCWGNNMAGQLGNGSTDQGVHWRAAKVPLADVVQVALGGVHSCALTKAGALYCWGQNVFRQVGVDNTGDVPCSVFGTSVSCRPTPTLVMGVANVKRIALGYSHSCVLTSDSGGTVMCWGANSGGQLGHDPASDGLCGMVRCTETPSAVVLSNAAEIAAGNVATFVVANNTLLGFGENGSGQLGLGTMDANAHPVPTPITQGGTIASGAASPIACTWTAQQATCWGSNEFGAIAANNVGPKNVLGLTPRMIDVSDLGSGSGHVCAVSQGNVLCWGWSGMGQVGHDPSGEPNIGYPYSEYQTMPRAVMGLSGVKGLAVGGATSCVLQTDNRVMCWGRNAHGECGHDPAADPLTVFQGYKCNWNPIAVVGLP